MLGLSRKASRAVQVQYSLLDRRPENRMAQFCAERGIKLLPYGVVGGGLLSDRYLGMPAAQCVQQRSVHSCLGSTTCDRKRLRVRCVYCEPCVDTLFAQWFTER